MAFFCFVFGVLVIIIRVYVDRTGGKMKVRTLAIGACMLAVAACGNDNPDASALRGANFVSAGPDVTISLAFAPDEMTVHGRIVNLYNGGYTADGNKIKFGEMATTRMMGPVDAMNAEQEYFQFLSTVQEYNFSDGRLTLRNAAGTEMVFNQVESLPDAE